MQMPQALEREENNAGKLFTVTLLILLTAGATTGLCLDRGRGERG